MPTRVVVAAGLCALAACGTSARVVDDLIPRVSSAVEARPAAESFSTLDATIAGVTRRAILTRGSSRLVFAVAVPERAAFDARIGVPEDVWAIPSSGVLFRVLIQAQHAEGPVQFYAKHLNPNVNRTDREWHDVRVDLSRFAGQTVRLFLNTNFTPPESPDPGGRSAGLGLWSDAKITAR